MKKELAVVLVALACLLGLVIGLITGEVLWRKAPTVAVSVPQPVATPVPVATPEPPRVWSFSDPRFRLVRFREDELLDVPLLSEAFRLATIKLGRTKEEPSAVFNDLFRGQLTEGLITVTHTVSGTPQHFVLLGRGVWTQGYGRVWTMPAIRHDYERDPLLWYRGNAISLRFTEADGRFVLTTFGEEKSDNSREDSAHELDDVTALVYYQPADGLYKATPELIHARLEHAKRILDRAVGEAVNAAPNAEGLRRPVDLDWSASESGYAASVTSHGVDGRTPIRIGIESLWAFSDGHLRQTTLHELGHVVRDHAAVGATCSDSGPDDPCQLAAEAFALKVMGVHAYRRVLIFAQGKKIAEADALIKRLDAINAKFPNS